MYHPTEQTAEYLVQDYPDKPISSYISHAHDRFWHRLWQVVFVSDERGSEYTVRFHHTSSRDTDTSRSHPGFFRARAVYPDARTDRAKRGSYHPHAIIQGLLLVSVQASVYLLEGRVHTRLHANHSGEQDHAT